MTKAERAAKAIKDATGWDTHQHDNGAVVTQASRKPPLNLWCSEDDWVCSLGGFPIGIGSTPEVALEAVLVPYRAHIASLVADILPGCQCPAWTPWTNGITELRCGLLLVVRLRQCDAHTIEGTVPAIGELPGNRGTIGTFSGENAYAAWVAYLTTLELPPPPPVSGVFKA